MDVSSRFRDRIADLGAVVFVLWFTLAQFGSRGFGEYEDVATHPDGLGFVLILTAVLPLLLRRRAPFVVFLVTLAPSIALVALGYAVHVHAAPAVALYTFFAAPQRGAVRPLIAAAVAGYVVLVTIAASVLPLSTEEYLLPAAFWIAACLIGDRRRIANIRAVEQRDRAEREQELAVAEERARIARELHDSAGHAINTIRVHAGAARVLRDRDPERSREAIETIEQVARETAADIDRIVGALRGDEPAELAPAAGVEEIAELVERQRAGGVEVQLRDSGEAAVPHTVARAAYRIAQETLTNAAKHGSGRVEVTIERGSDALVLTVVNAVAGEPAERPGGGRGISGMRERTVLLGGTLDAGLVDGRFRVRAVLPYSREE